MQMVEYFYFLEEKINNISKQDVSGDLVRLCNCSNNKGIIQERKTAILGFIDLKR